MTKITPKIVQLEEKKLLGISQNMSIVNNTTPQLWAAFGPRIKEIPNKVSTDKYSLQVYPEGYFDTFQPQISFEKWALVEINNWEVIPEGMHKFHIQAGGYAVFDYTGNSNDPSIFQYIYTQWIPQSEYQLDNRPHFEVLGDKYANNNPNSEEQIWIPIRKK